jgi:unsaturated rhamnogalacturonyl hydrolase
MPTTIEGIEATEIHKSIKLLINNLVSITDTTGEFLLTLPDGRVIDTKGWNDWEWTHGIGLYGLYIYHMLTNDASTLQIIENWFSDRFATGGTTKNINPMAAFLTLAYLYEKFGNQTYLPWLDSWAEWAINDLPRTEYGGMQHITYDTENKQQLWDDTLMMTVLPLAKIGKVLNRPHYVEEAKRQFLVHIKYLFDTQTGLFFHGWTFDGNHNFASARWARGNSWLTIAIPEFIELLDLDERDPIRIYLIDTLEAQCRALKELQDASGLWRTLLDHIDKGSYIESSATAGFAYGVLKARRKHYIGPEYDDMAIRAVKAVMGQIDEKGELQNTSFGTAMGHTLQFYKDIPRTSMPYGQAMAIMALGEFLRRFI